MKKLLIITGLLSICFSAFGLTLRTGESTNYFPVSAPMVASKSGDSSSCFITKIEKATGYPAGTYEVQLTSCDWVGATVFPIVFTYILKQGDSLELKYCSSIYSRENKKFTVKSISENEIILDEQKSNLGDINTTEDSL